MIYRHKLDIRVLEYGNIAPQRCTFTRESTATPPAHHINTTIHNTDMRISSQQLEIILYYDGKMTICRYKFIEALGWCCL